MKFKVNQSEFSKALLTVSKSLLTKANLPILSSILITATKNKVEIVATNLETATETSFNSQIEIEGRVAVVGKTLLEFVSQIPEGEMVVEKLGEEVLVSTKGYKARFNTMNAEDFPAIPKIEKGMEFEVSGQELSNAVSRVAFSASQDEGRPVLTGILLELVKGKVSMVATDGYRLSFQEVVATKSANAGLSSSESGLKIIMPARAAIEVAKIIAARKGLGVEDGKDGIKINVSDNLNQIVFKVDDVEFTSRLIEGEFPAWQKIIPGEFASKVKIDKNEFVRLVRMASIFAREAGSIIRLKFEGKTLEVSANTNQVGSTDLLMDVEVSGKGGEIAFNFRYLLEVLAVLEDEEVYFEMIESLNPGKITTESDKNKFFHIIMPVRLQA